MAQVLLLYYANFMPPQSSRPDDDNDILEFEQSLQAVEEALQLLKARYAQVQTNRQQQQDLQQRLSQTERELKRSRTKALQSELKQIRQQLEEVEIALESQLFSWSGLREIFWQAIRFGGVGIVIGWILKSCASGN